MGVIWSHGIKCDRKAVKTLIDNENWFKATLIEYSTLTNLQSTDRNFTLPRTSKNETAKPTITFNKTFKKFRKCSGRITIHDDCIIFQAVDCNELLKTITNHHDRSPKSPDTVFVDSPDLLPSKPNGSQLNSSSSTENDCTDRLHTFVWPIEAVRHFGFKDNFFSFDSGRYSSTGEGRFTFKIKKLASFSATFQTTKDQLNYSKPAEIVNKKYVSSFPITRISPDYYNLATSESYPLSKSDVAVDLPWRKRASKSTDFFFNTQNSLSPVNDRKGRNVASSVQYSYIDFSQSYVNVQRLDQSMPNIPRRPKSNTKSCNGDSVNYLTICENQTKAVEKVLQRIG